MPRSRRPRAGPRRAACPRSSPPPTTRSSPRPGCAPASACSSTAPPAASAPPACSSARAAGAHVTATVRNADLRDGVAELGAHEVIDPEGFAEHGPFDVVLELVGAPNLPGDLQALATSGRIVVIGVGGGAKAEVNLCALMGKRATRARLDAARRARWRRRR